MSKKLPVFEMSIIGAMLLIVLLTYGIVNLEKMTHKKVVIPEFELTQPIAIQPKIASEVTAVKVSEFVSMSKTTETKETVIPKAGIQTIAAAKQILPAPANKKSAPLPQIAAPAILSQTLPVYPLQEVQEGIEGTVVMELLISSSGSVSDSRIAQSSGNANLDRSAKDAIQSWKFAPAKKGSDAIESWFKVPVKFTLK